MDFVNVLITILEQGLIYGILILGLAISYKILNFPDLGVDGSFPLGAAVTVALITRGWNPWAALLASIASGLAAGCLTGLLNVKLKISPLLSGIIVMTCLWSVNLVIAGRSNLPLFGMETIFNSGPAALIPESLGGFQLRTLIVSFLVVTLLKLGMDGWLGTRSGLLLRAVGDNQQIVVAVARDPGRVRVVGIALANGLVALSGAIVAQQQGFFEISMGTGQMVAGLASVIIGVVLFRKRPSIRLTTQVLAGSVIYKALTTIAIQLGLPAAYMKIMQGLLFLLVLVASRLIIKEDSDATASSRE